MAGSRKTLLGRRQEAVGKSNNMIESYKDLKVWKKGIEVVKEIYRITKELPEYEKFGLVV